MDRKEVTWVPDTQSERNEYMGQNDEREHWQENKTQMEKASDVLTSSWRYTSRLSLLSHLPVEHQRNSSHTVWERRDNTGEQWAKMGPLDGRLEWSSGCLGPRHHTQTSLPTRLWVIPIPVCNSALTESHMIGYGHRIWGQIDQALIPNGKFYGPWQVTLTLCWDTQLFFPVNWG